MRFLADENFPRDVIGELRASGHDVTSAKETLRAEADELVLRAAMEQSRIVLTCDKDFGQLAFQSRLPAHCGVVLFRLGGSSPENDNARMIRVLASRTDWAGHFSVVTDSRLRVRRLPD